MSAAAALLLFAGAVPRAIDNFDDIAPWHATASDDVSGAASSIEGVRGKALRLDYDFHDVAGFAAVRRELPVRFPANFALSFRIRGEGGTNELQLKFVDASGYNVWWLRRAEFRPSRDWQTVRVAARDVAFAWGPASDRALRATAAVELAIVHGRDGGRGHVDIDDLEMTPLAPDAAGPPPAPPSANATISRLAAAAPRGSYPRGFTEQSYWTLVGTDGGADSALIGEDGAIEVGKGGFSIEPFVLAEGRRFGWPDVTASQSLEGGYLPMPHVLWRAPGWRLDTALLDDATVAGGRLMARYRLTNTGPAQRSLRLALAIRPFQVNPAAQFLSQQGGVSPISAIAVRGGTVSVETSAEAAVARTVSSLLPPTASVAADSAEGNILDRLGGSGQARPVRDPAGLASAALLYDFTLAPGETAEVPLVVPFAGQAGAAPDRASFSAAHDATVAYWRARLDGVAISLPPSRRHLADSVRSAVAQMLMSRSGPALKPGTRSYDRSWIRDGAMISDGLLRVGQARPVADYIGWYSGHLFTTGKVPCCVDFRGADPTPENDSHGEYIYLLTQYYRFTGDRATLAAQWPRLRAAADYMETLRQSERTAANRSPERRMLYGLMPPSISHEGYSAKPQYSLWDDFWALRGYKDAAFAATVLGASEAAEFARRRDEFATDLHGAIAAAAEHWKIGFLPGATSLGDFDATSTTIALEPGDEQERLDPRLLAGTYERYWQEFAARRDGRAAWKDYTPYELRNVSAFIRLGWRERANALLDFFFAGQRPRAWNGWAEVVGRDPREIRFIGDMPHAWVASDYVRAALDMFAYERDDRSIVIAAGLLPTDLAGSGAGIRGLRTAAGTLDLTLRATPRRLLVAIGGTARPAGGFLLPWPLPGRPGAATVDGRPADFAADGLYIPATGKPVAVVVRR